LTKSKRATYFLHMNSSKKCIWKYRTLSTKFSVQPENVYRA